MDSAPAQALGAVPLKPEHSRHLSAGVVVTPVAPLDVTVDYYRIAIDDRIVLSGNFTAAPIAALLAPFGANSARFFTNAIDTRTSGVDVAADYRFGGRGGDLQLRAGYNYTRTRSSASFATPPQLAGYESVLFDRIEQRRIECGAAARQRAVGRRLAAPPLGRRLRARYGEFCSFTLNPADDQTYTPKWLTDVDVSYHLRGYVCAGAKNISTCFPIATRRSTRSTASSVSAAVTVRLQWKGDLFPCGTQAVACGSGTSEPHGYFLTTTPPSRRQCTGRRGLVAVDGERVAAGPERARGLGRQRRELVVGRVAGRLQRQHAVDVDLGVLVVMQQRMRIARREKSAGSSNVRRSQMSGVFHSVRDDAAGRVARAEAAGAARPRRVVEIRRHPAVGGLGRDV